MKQVTFNLPDEIADTLQEIAQASGSPNAKVMTIAYWRHEIRTHRGNKALEGVREAAEIQADEDTEEIT